MSEEHYAPPQSDVAASSSSLHDIVVPLIATKPWARLCSILGFILTVLMVISGLFLMVLGGSVGPAGAGVGVVYIIFSLFYFFPSLFLFRFASAIGTAQQSETSGDIVNALQHQKSFWKFAGIVACVMVVFGIIGILAAIIIPMAAR